MAIAKRPIAIAVMLLLATGTVVAPDLPDDQAREALAASLTESPWHAFRDLQEAVKENTGPRDVEGGWQQDLALVRAAVAFQAFSQGIPLPERTPRHEYQTPSEALDAILELHGIAWPEGTVAPVEQLNALDATLAGALVDLLQRYLDYAAAVRAAGAAGSAVPHAMGNIFAARHTLLEAAFAFDQVFSVQEPPLLDNMEMPTIVVPPALAIDLAGQNNTYTHSVAFLLDVGGDDTYLNNGGGSNLKCAGGFVSLPVAAFLADLDGYDHYGSDQTQGCNGVNGGCYANYPQASGMLVDLRGNDAYYAGPGGTNGGGRGCPGFLFDGAGDDAYISGGWAGNGGGSGFWGMGSLMDLAGNDAYILGPPGGFSGRAHNGGGAVLGSGLLLDAEGNDFYSTGCCGANGGGAWQGTGALLDLGGNDTYKGDHGGVNGGAIGGSGGFLWDRRGDDRYTALVWGVNGGAARAWGLQLEPIGYPPVFELESLVWWVLLDLCQWAVQAFTSCMNPDAAGFLLDEGGHDLYEDRDGGAGWDRTVVPKGVMGAQVDDRDEALSQAGAYLLSKLTP